MAEKKRSLKRELGLWSLVAICVGSVIGSGLFVIPAIMGSVAGPAFLVSVILVGLIIMVLGLIYAELGAAYPMEGGPYSLPRKALGNDAGFVLGWGYFIYAFTGTAAIIDVFITYVGYYIPGLAVNYVLTPLGIGIALLMIAIFTLINIVGIREGKWYGILTTMGKLIPLLLFVAIGLFFFKIGNFSPFMPFGLAGLGLAMALDFFAFTGFESVVIPEGEVKNPGKTIPRAMVLTILTVIAKKSSAIARPSPARPNGINGEKFPILKKNSPIATKRSSGISLPIVVSMPYHLPSLMPTMFMSVNIAIIRSAIPMPNGVST